MKRLHQRSMRILLTFTVLASSTPPAAFADWKLFSRPPATSVERLAANIDRLEKHIEAFGSVVAKKPDVWGEARLTRHRREVEEILAEKLDDFAPNINASLTRSDQAFLANAIALSNATGGSAGTSPAVAIANQTAGLAGEPKEGETAAPPVALYRNSVQTGSGLGFTTEEGKSDAISLEPVIGLDQLRRYLSHLNEIRRANEGDDIGDSPGYTINLVKIPVSVLPGAKTREGFGAEISVTARPHLSDATLPETFRRWVINDLVDELTLPTLRRVDDKSWEMWTKAFLLTYEFLNEVDTFPPAYDVVYSELQPTLFQYVEVEQAKDGSLIGVMKARGDTLSKELKNSFAAFTGDFMNVLSILNDPTGPSRQRRARYSVPASVRSAVYARSFSYANHYGKPTPFLFEMDRLSNLAERMNNALRLKKDPYGRIPILDARAFIGEELKAAYDFLILEGARNPRLWSLADGLHEVVRGGHDLELLERQKEFARIIHDSIPTEWQQATPVGVPGAVVEQPRRSVRSKPYPNQLVQDLAWCILVEMALLNEHIVEDMARVAAEKNSPCILSNPHARLYYPSAMLDPQTIAEFNTYVSCRWPIKIFALDPVTQDQNVADSFSLRRELQLAASIALASGEMNIDQFTQFARRIELDSQTIALNRTIVGFSHGDDTFGWRMQPRFQSPDIPGSVKAFHQTLWGGPSKDSLLKQRRLEPGIRECTAVVITPGFVPYVVFDTRSNWYQLTDPEKKQFDLQDTVRIGKEVVDLRRSKAMCIREQHLYREGDIYRLMRAVDQLEARLPLQTAFVQMPIDSTQSGFRTVSSGTTNLGPELHGFYGQPGYDGKETSVFVVGDNFSVHDTRVIAGGRQLRMVDSKALVKTATAKEGSEDVNVEYRVTEQPRQVRMLSRQVLEVVLPEGLKPMSRKYTEGGVEQKFVTVRVGTPYGMSGSIDIPYIESEADKKAKEEKAKEEKAVKEVADASAKAAVAAHVSSQHPISYELDAEKSKDAAAVIMADHKSVHAVQLTTASELSVFKVVISKDSKDLHDVLHQVSHEGQLAFRMEVSSKDKKKAAFKKTVGPFNFALDSEMRLTDVVASVERILQSKLPADFDASEIKLQPFVRFISTDPNVMAADRPVYQVAKPLTIRVSNTEICPACPPAGKVSLRLQPVPN